ncbi:MAG: hypothetical protein M3021_09890, partial [Actinomycetota bacterium]|nr:hypothetical protein [Actinomycetota bacterium]
QCRFQRRYPCGNRRVRERRRLKQYHNAGSLPPQHRAGKVSNYPARDNVSSGLILNATVHTVPGQRSDLMKP